MNDLQTQQKLWLAARLQHAGRGARTRLAKELGVRNDAITRMTNVKGGEMRDISVEELAGMAKFFKDTPPGLVAPRELSPPPMRRAKEVAHIPLLDKVAAGKLKSPSSQIPVEDVPLLAYADLGRGDFFALTVEGDSMDRIAPDGSMIIVNQAERTLVSGKPYVFSVRGAATFKLWRPDPPRLAPFSTNPIHEPVYVKSKAEAEKLVVGRVKRSVLDL